MEDAVLQAYEQAILEFGGSFPVKHNHTRPWNVEEVQLEKDIAAHTLHGTAVDSRPSQVVSAPPSHSTKSERQGDIMANGQVNSTVEGGVTGTESDDEETMRERLRWRPVSPRHRVILPPDDPDAPPELIAARKRLAASIEPEEATSSDEAADAARIAQQTPPKPPPQVDKRSRRRSEIQAAPATGGDSSEAAASTGLPRSTDVTYEALRRQYVRARGRDPGDYNAEVEAEEAETEVEEVGGEEPSNEAVAEAGQQSGLPPAVEALASTASTTTGAPAINPFAWGPPVGPSYLWPAVPPWGWSGAWPVPPGGYPIGTTMPPKEGAAFPGMMPTLGCGWPLAQGPPPVLAPTWPWLSQSTAPPAAGMCCPIHHVHRHAPWCAAGGGGSSGPSWEAVMGMWMGYRMGWEAAQQQQQQLQQQPSAHTIGATG